MKKREDIYLPVEKSQANLLANIEDAIKWSAKCGNDIAVFRNEFGFHISRELKYCEPTLNVIFVVINRFLKVPVKKVSKKR